MLRRFTRHYPHNRVFRPPTWFRPSVDWGLLSEAQRAISCMTCDQSRPVQFLFCTSASNSWVQLDFWTSFALCGKSRTEKKENCRSCLLIVFGHFLVQIDAVQLFLEDLTNQIPTSFTLRDLWIQEISLVLTPCHTLPHTNVLMQCASLEYLWSWSYDCYFVFPFLRNAETLSLPLQ